MDLWILFCTLYLRVLCIIHLATMLLSKMNCPTPALLFPEKEIPQALPPPAPFPPQKDKLVGQEEVVLGGIPFLQKAKVVVTWMKMVFDYGMKGDLG